MHSQFSLNIRRSKVRYVRVQLYHEGLREVKRGALVTCISCGKTGAGHVNCLGAGSVDARVGNNRASADGGREGRERWTQDGWVVGLRFFFGNMRNKMLQLCFFLYGGGGMLPGVVHLCSCFFLLRMLKAVLLSFGFVLKFL